MDIVQPTSSGYTIYSKSGCSGCTAAKRALNQLNEDYIEIDCDDFLIEDRDSFIDFIVDLVRSTSRIAIAPPIFPFIFYNGKYVGKSIDAFA